MRKIPLTQGQFAIVDAVDYERLSKIKWYAHRTKCNQSFYAAKSSKRVNGKHYLISMAREILGLKRGDKLQGDHINHQTLDNRRCNLRIVTNQENQFNRKNPKGYYWDEATNKWRARIKINGKTKHIGLFNTAKAAHVAYLQAKKRLHQIPGAIAMIKPAP